MSLATNTPTEVKQAPGAALHAKPSARSRLRRRLVEISDGVALSAGAVVADLWSGPTAAPIWLAALFVVVFWISIFATNLYNSRLVTLRGEEMGRMGTSAARALVVIGVVAIVIDLDLALRSALVLTMCCVVAALIGREAWRWWFRRRRRAGVGMWQSVLVCEQREAERFKVQIAADSSSPHAVVAHVDPAGTENAEHLLTEVLAVARANSANGVIVVESAIEASTANRVVRGLLKSRLYVDLASSVMDIAADRLATRTLGTSVATWIAPRPKAGWRGRAKRVFDVVVSSTVLLLILPVFVLLAALVRTTSPGPVFFRQERMGRYKKPFYMLKFRSMVVDAEELLDQLSEQNEGDGPLFKMKEDPRVTRLGRFMRKTSLDELPQLINVLKNDMSLVGPRPALKDEMAHWDSDLFERLDVKPGITGMWQVSGRSGTSFEEYSRLDLYYVNNWSLGGDLSILFKTIPAVLKSDGAF